MQFPGVIGTLSEHCNENWQGVGGHFRAVQSSYKYQHCDTSGTSQRIHEKKQRMSEKNEYLK